MQKLALALALGFVAGPLDAAPLPELEGRVSDLAQILGPDRSRALEERLLRYEQQTGHQFALLTIDTLDGDPLEDFSIRLAEKWKLGDAKRDDGLIFLVVKNDRKMRIEVGYGLEGGVPDLVAKRVLDDYVTPHFRTGDFAGGIELGFDQLMKAAAGDALGPPPPTHPPTRRPRGSGRGLSGLLVLFFIIFFMSALRFLLPALVGALIGYSMLRIPGAIFGGMVGLYLGIKGGSGRGGSRGVWIGGFGGSSGFGGGSSGGFSGGFSGGGGSFGGGGASGSW